MRITSLILSLWLALSAFGAITDRYVTDAGAGTADGSSIENAMSFATFVDFMSTGGSTNAAAGDRFNIIGTITSRTTTTDTFVNGGTSTSPVIIRGWKSDNTTAYAGRTNGNGPLITTDFPTITYTTGRINVTGSFIILQFLSVSSAASSRTITLTADSVIDSCVIVNSGTNSASSGCTISTRCILINSDVSLTGASGGSEAVLANAASSLVDSNRITVVSSAEAVEASSSTSIIFNTIYGAGGIGISMQSTSGVVLIRNNTIQGCAGDGIDIITGTTGLQRVIGNMITDNGGYGVDFNSTAVAGFVAYNRTRDNTSGAYNSGTDWVTATSYGNVTTDTGGVSTDYVNAGSGDFNLIAGSPATSASLPQYASMGALQRSQTGGGSTQTATAYVE